MSIYTATAGIDSQVNYEDPDVNYGTLYSVQVGSAYLSGAKTIAERIIGNFDVSALSGRTINSAKLRYKVGSISGGGGWAATIYRCTRPSTWTEGGVTWNKYDGTNSWTSGGGDYDGSTPTPVGFSTTASLGWNEIAGLAGFVTDALSLRSGIVSLIIRADDEDPGTTKTQWWYSKDSKLVAAGGPWRLVVDHSGNPIGLTRHPGRGFLRGDSRGVQRGGV